MPSQAVDDDAVHFGKLLGSEVIDPSLDLAPWRAVVPGGSVVGWFEDAGRFLVQDYPAVGEMAAHIPGERQRRPTGPTPRQP